MKPTLERLFLYKAFSILLVGTILGLLYIARAGNPSLLIYWHPYFQIYSLVYFVSGIALNMLPKFKSSNIYMKNVILSVLILYDLSFILFIISYFNTFFIEISALILLISSLFLVFYFIRFSLIKANFPEADPFFILSSLSFFLFSFSLLIIGQLTFESQLLFFLGFIGSLIYAVEVRMVAVRQTINYRILTHCSLLFMIVSLLSLFLHLTLFLNLYYSLLSFFVSFIIMAFSLRIFESKRPLTIHKFGPREKKLVYYNQGAMIVSYIWIILGLLFFVSNIINIDMFIHSVSLGFIGNTIFAFAPIFVSNLFSKTDPLKSMRFEALVIYNIGVLLRVIGSYYAFPIWSLLSGLLILIAIFILVFRILS